MGDDDFDKSSKRKERMTQGLPQDMVGTPSMTPERAPIGEESPAIMKPNCAPKRPELRHSNEEFINDCFEKRNKESVAG